MLKQFQMLYFRYKSMSAWVTKVKSDTDSNNNTAQGKNIFDVLKAASRSYTHYPTQRYTMNDIKQVFVFLYVVYLLDCTLNL